jgi:hypothetical protein
MQWLQSLKDALRRFAPGAGAVLPWCGGALLLLAAGFGLHAWLRTRPLVKATATVSENVASFAPGGGVVYYPRLRFRTATGELVQALTSRGSEDVDFPAGTNLPILYPANNPQAAVIATVPRIYPGALAFGILGVVVLDLGVIFLLMDRHSKHAKTRL